MTKVLKADATAAAAYAEFALPSSEAELWITFGLYFDSAALTDWDANESGYFAEMLRTGDYVCGPWGASPGPTWAGAADTTATALVAGAWRVCELHYRDSDGLEEFYVSGTLIISDTAFVLDPIDAIRAGQDVPGLPGSIAYIKDFKVGTTRGGTDIFADDFSSGDLSAWSSTSGAVSVIDDPAPTPPDTSGLIIKIYDLGTTELADISSIALEKSLIRQLNGPRGFTVTAPAGHTLLTTIAYDTYPNLRRFNRKLVVWEDADPDVDDPIFHGRIFITERDGDENSVQVKITAYDPWMELGFDADNRAGRLVRDSSTTTFGDPSFLSPEFTSSVEGQDEISGPDLMKQILTYSQADPTTNPIQGEGPLPIDLVSGTWDLDVPPAIDLNPVDSADWPQLVGDFFNQLIQSGAVDLDMRPVRPGTGHNLDDDPDDYIMVEASAKSKIGTDRSATVHFDYLTGDHNAARCKLIEDGSTICQRLWYELGPRLSRQHWRGDITPHSSGQLGDASAAIYGGPGDVKGYFVSTRIFDSLGTETSSRPLYTALYMDEVGLRRESRDFLYITPASGGKALFMAPQQFDAFDVIALNVGAGFGIELADVQRVFGYTKTWTRENVANLGQLVTSADYSPGNE